MAARTGAVIGRLAPAHPRPRILVTCFVALLVLGACSGADGDDEPNADATPAVVDGDGSSAALRCDLVGYPCAWADADQEVLQASQDLLVEAKGRLDDGATAEEGLAAAGAWLEEQPGVVEVSWDRDDFTGLMVRLDGGLPVFLETALAGPVNLEVLEAELTGASAADTIDPDATDADAPQVGGSGRVVAAGYSPPREPGQAERSAIVFDPYADVEPWRVEGRVVKDVLERHEDFRGNVVYEKDPQVSDLSGWDEYDVVHIATHSSSWCDDMIEGPVEVRCFTQVAWGDWVDPDPLPGGVTPFLDKYGVFRLMVRSSYLVSVPAPETIVYLSSCESAGSASDDVPPPLSTSFGAFIGWDEVALASGAEATATTFWDLMSKHGLDIETTFERLEELDLHRTPTPVNMGNRWENAREWLGIVPVAELQHFGQNLRARDVIEVKVDGDVVDAGSIVRISDESEAGDGIDDLVPEVVLRVDGVADGTEGDVTLELRVGESSPTSDDDRVTPKTFPLTRGTAVETNDGGWAIWEVSLRDVILPFDLERDDLDPDDPTEYVWEARAYERQAEYSAHIAEPVTFSAWLLAEGKIGFFDQLDQIPNARLLENRVALRFPTDGGEVIGGVSIVLVESEDLPAGSFTGTWGGDLMGTYDSQTDRIELTTQIEVEGAFGALVPGEDVTNSAGGAVTGTVNWGAGTIPLTFEFGDPQVTAELAFGPARDATPPDTSDPDPPSPTAPPPVDDGSPPAVALPD